MRMWWPRSEPHTQAGLESGAALPERASLTGTGRPGTPCDRDALKNVKCANRRNRRASLSFEELDQMNPHYQFE